jgi:5-(carboxyamino)imidazole ribonucleotide synthase
MGAAQVILPGQTVGIYGGGQLGRMLAIAARESGYQVHVFTSDRDAPAAHFANRVTIADDSDETPFRAFASAVDVLTFEFENVSAQSLQWVPRRVPIRPGANVFWIAQDRLREKNFLRHNGIPIPTFASCTSLAELKRAVDTIGLPAVLKTSAGGYDGKGQFLIRDEHQVEEAWQTVGARACTLEAFVDLACEVSVIVARDIGGSIASYGPIENQHANHILDFSICPAGVSREISDQAQQIASQITTAFDLVGLICIEFFVSRDGRVLVNEIAPRTHNSGHLTIEAFATSQFEQQLRTVCGLPVGSVEQIRHAAMINLLGDRWFPNDPDWCAVFETPESHLHLYDKSEPKMGRKMGHVTVCGATREEVLIRAQQIRDRLGLTPKTSLHASLLK